MKTIEAKVRKQIYGIVSEEKTIISKFSMNNLLSPML